MSFVLIRFAPACTAVAMLYTSSACATPGRHGSDHEHHHGAESHVSEHDHTHGG